MLIESGPAQVIEGGVVTTFGGHGLVLVLELPEDNLAVELVFASEPDAAAAVEAEETDVGWRFRCRNFDDPGGRGSAEPVLLGEIGDDLVFFHFRVFRYGASADRTVHYTFFRASKVKVGWAPTAG